MSDTLTAQRAAQDRLRPIPGRVAARQFFGGLSRLPSPPRSERLSLGDLDRSLLTSGNSRPHGECCFRRARSTQQITRRVSPRARTRNWRGGRGSRGSGSPLRGRGSARRSVPSLGLRREVPSAAMRTGVRAPFAASSPASQVAVVPDTPQSPGRAGGRAVADLLLAALHLSFGLIGRVTRGREAPTGA